MKIHRPFLVAFMCLIAHVGLSQASTANQTASTLQSFYVPAVNGTRLAVDVHFPDNYADEKLPALFELTRYWRSAEDPSTGAPVNSLGRRDRYFLENGYILVKVDARGTGASYGTRPGEYSPTEVMDAKFVVDWVIAQSWSDGNVGAYGTSYSGTTAELLCATQHPAVKAVIPGWSDFDVYESPTRPYGMVATSFIAEWSQYVGWLDNNNSEILRSSVRRVTNDIPQEAIAEHANNPNVLNSVMQGKYKDSKFSDFTYEESSPLHWQKQISDSRIPMLVLTSWMDAGTAEGTLLRLQHFKNPQKVVMMATSHGGGSHASPFIVSDKVVAPVPTVNEQLQLQLDFFDHYLKSKDNSVEDWPMIQYYNFGEEDFKQSNSWPPRDQQRSKYYLTANQLLSPTAPDQKDGMDKYEVDYTVSTGANNRWKTQMGEHVFNLDNRNAADALMLTYTSEPLSEDLQITGSPFVTLNLSSTHAEGAVFVYLEVVDPEGRSRYITEGGLLLEHRKQSKNPMYKDIPYQSFYKADASPMPVGEVEEVSFKLWPTSVLIKKGHSIRIAIAGADKDTFDRVPAEGNPIFQVFRNKTRLSYIDLPILPSN